MISFTFIIGNYKNGGVATRATNLANSFAKKGHFVILLACGEVADSLFLPLEDNVRLVQLDRFFNEYKSNPAVQGDARSRNAKAKVYKNIRAFSKWSKKLDKHFSDVVKSARREKLRAYFVLHPHDVYIAFGLGNFENIYFATLGDDVKIIYAEKNAAELELPACEEARKEIFCHMSRLSGAVLQTNDEMRFYASANIKNVVVINNPLKGGLPEPYFGKRVKKVVNFCRVSAQKNLPLLFDAFELFHKTHPYYELEVFGNTVADLEEQLKQQLAEELKKSGRNEYIRILPPAGNVHELVREYAMFVSSSDYEGLSNSMIEAMAIGLPCVCTDCLGGGTREVITDGENGLIVPMNDPSAMAKAMAKITDDEELSEKLSKNAAKIRERLSAERIADKWLEVIENAL